MIKGGFVLTLPNPHKQEISVDRLLISHTHPENHDLNYNYN